MPYIEDENGNHILDENGDKIEYTVTYDNLPDEFKYREPIHLNDDGHLDTENRHLVIKDGVNSNHAISLQQLINNNEDIIKPYIETQIQQALAQFKAQQAQEAVTFLNNQVAMRIGRKSGTIPKTNYKWIKLLSKDDIKGINTLQEIIVTNTYIRRNDIYHHSKSDLVSSSFDQLESLEKFPNFQVGLNLGFPCFFVGFPLISKLGKNAKYPILICKLDFY